MAEKESVSMAELKSLAKQAVNMEAQERYLEAYREKFQSDPLQSRWETGTMRGEVRAKAHIFCVMARGFEDKLGIAEGREAARETRRKQGAEMGNAMAATVKARGGKLNLNNFFEEFWRYFAWNPVSDVTKTYDEKGNITSYRLRLPCPIGEYLRENAPDVDFSANYCDLDEFIAKGFNSNITYHRDKWVPRGDLYCEIIWELDSKDIS